MSWQQNNPDIRLHDREAPATVNVRLSDLVEGESFDSKFQQPSTSQNFYDQKVEQFQRELDVGFQWGSTPSVKQEPSFKFEPIDTSSSNNPSLHQQEGPLHIKLADTPGAHGSSLFAVKSFEDMGLSPELLKGVYSMGYSLPSKIQEVAIPLIKARPPRNLIGQSQSGTGKTAAFALAMLTRIDPNLQKTQAIVLAPSRELSRQILVSIQGISKFTNITSTAIIKDFFKQQRLEGKRDVSLNEQIIVGTPGIILDCLRRKRSLNVQHLKMFVLDEADHMLDQDGLGDQSIRIKNLITTNPQILLFSATFPDYVYKFAHRFAPEPNEITLRVEELSVDYIKQCYMDCINEEQKYNVVCEIYDLLTISQSIIFCKLRSTADNIAQKMRDTGHIVGSIHGNMTPDERDKKIDEFRRGVFKVLITTNLISRGIDISQVSLVVNYDMPLDMRGDPDAEVYLHRIGRTGRFGRVGVSIIFVHDEKTYQYVRFLENHFKVNITRIPTEDWQETEKVFKSLL